LLFNSLWNITMDGKNSTENFVAVCTCSWVGHYHYDGRKEEYMSFFNTLKMDAVVSIRTKSGGSYHGTIVQMDTFTVLLKGWDDHADKPYNYEILQAAIEVISS
jgi:hypothetical protein